MSRADADVGEGRGSVGASRNEPYGKWGVRDRSAEPEGYRKPNPQHRTRVDTGDRSAADRDDRTNPNREEQSSAHPEDQSSADRDEQPSTEPESNSNDPDAEDDTHLDAVVELGDEIATLSAHIHAATQRLLVMIARFDRMRGWEMGGHRSCAHWLSFRTGVDLGTAREKVRTARALEALPQTRESMARGEVSFSQVRAITRVADAENEEELLEFARGSITAQLERIVRGWKRWGRMEEAEVERARHQTRGVSIFANDDGMYGVRGILDPEVGAVLMRAIEAASDALYRSSTAGDGRSEISPKQRRADAVGLLAERALAAGFEVAEAFEAEGGGEARSESESRVEPASGLQVEPFEVADPSGYSDSPDVARVSARDVESDSVVESEPVLFEGRSAGARRDCTASRRPGDGPDEATSDAVSTPPVPISGIRAERYQVMLHVDVATLDAEAEPGGSELDDGLRVSAETSRRISCDGAVVKVTQDGNGSVLDVGRRTRTIPPALRRALEVRDRGCRFPGCGLRFTDAHHIRHWADGGETSLDNCLLLCRFHHRLVHEEGWKVVVAGSGEPVFLDPRGGSHIPARRGPNLRQGSNCVRGSGRSGARVSKDPPDSTCARGSQAAASSNGGRGSGSSRSGDHDVRQGERAPRIAPRRVSTLVRANRARGADPNGRTAGAMWKREADVPDEVLFRTMESLG